MNYATAGVRVAAGLAAGAAIAGIVLSPGTPPGLLCWIGAAVLTAILGVSLVLMDSGLRDLGRLERTSAKAERRESGRPAADREADALKRAELLREAAAAIALLEVKVHALTDIATSIKAADCQHQQATLPADAGAAEWPANVTRLPVIKRSTN